MVLISQSPKTRRQVRGARRGQGTCSESPEGALRTGWGCDRHTCTHTQTRMHTQTQTHTQTHKSMQTCAPSHPTHTGMHKAHPETHTSHTHTHMLGHRKCGKTHTHTHTRASRYKHKNAGTRTHTHSGTDTQTHQRTHADHTGANAQTRTHTPHGDARDNRTGAAAHDAGLSPRPYFLCSFCKSSATLPSRSY